tara:strand:- start:306 stop:521 length:216 start_codon:yes stop_codon:yes gene_type:complete
VIILVTVLVKVVAALIFDWVREGTVQELATDELGVFLVAGLNVGVEAGLNTLKRDGVLYALLEGESDSVAM